MIDRTCAAAPLFGAILFASPVLAAPLVPEVACSRPDAPLPVRVACQHLILADQRLWPGFEPAAIPLAIYDGKDTWLFGHPHPPESCAAHTTWREVRVCPGRLEAVQANSAVQLESTTTATLMLAPDRPAREQAAVAIHEGFHAFQARAYPGWGGNEVDLFAYPFEDAEALALQRLEGEALTRALQSSDSKQALGWAKAALAQRRERFARLSPSAAAYERGGELKEGLAQYVEDQALAADPVRRWPADGFGAEDIRHRVYASGQALATLVDRFDPYWKSRLDPKGEVTLDRLLDRALAEHREVTGASFPDERTAAARARAAADVTAIVVSRTEAIASYRARTGPAIEVETAGEPLSPLGFDPLNVRRVGLTQVLHGRFVRLGNASGAIEIMGRESLSEAVGPHPLFSGVKRLLVNGLPSAPTVARDGDAVVVTADGVTARFRGATVERDGARIRIRLGR